MCGKAAWRNESGLEMYLPETQAGPEGAELVVRSQLPPEALGSSLMRTLRQNNPGSQRPSFVRSKASWIMRFRRGVFRHAGGIFAGLGLLLASLGIYGVISYAVTRRTQEIGIRMALGASRWNVQSRVIWRTLRLVLLGMVVGLGVSLAASRLIAALLFGTAPSDPKTFGAVALVLLAVALLAGYLPAWRASRINPMIALRNN